MSLLLAGVPGLCDSHDSQVSLTGGYLSSHPIWPREGRPDSPSSAFRGSTHTCADQGLVSGGHQELPIAPSYDPALPDTTLFQVLATLAACTFCALSASPGRLGHSRPVELLLHQHLLNGLRVERTLPPKIFQMPQQ